ncbi:MAG TPA: hypothetical protein VMW69_16700, partial [Spirochaetia bacterium]|nr:hypothetical protein [Spirochaetia bacterium]
MQVKDRERLALSTGIVLVGYVIIVLLLAGLHWPPDFTSRSIRAPLSVYVNLEDSGQSTTLSAPPKASQKPVAPTSEITPATPIVTTPSPQKNPSLAPPVSNPLSAPTPTAQPSIASQSTPSEASSSSSSTSSPATSGIPSSMTSSAGPTSSTATSQPDSNPSGAAAQSGAALSGATSPTPGVTYPPGSSSAAPPQGSGGTGTQSNQGQSQTFFGPAAPNTGSIFNPQLAAAAGSTNGTANGSGSANSGSGTSTGSGQAASSGSSTGGGSAAPSSGSGGTGSGASSAPKIEWKGDSSSRKVQSQPDPLVIPKDLLSEIPPKITVRITFDVTPLGTVNTLNIDPSLVYPGLDNVLREWMDKWQFEPVAGDKVAQ